MHKLAQQPQADFTEQNSVLISHFTHNLTLPKTQYTASHQTHQSQHKRINPTANEDRNGARYHGVGLGRRCAGGNWGPSRFGCRGGRCCRIVFDGDVKLHPTKAIQVVATDEVPVPRRGQGKRWVPIAAGLQYSVGRVARLVTLFRYLAHAVGRRVLEHCSIVQNDEISIAFDVLSATTKSKCNFFAFPTLTLTTTLPDFSRKRKKFDRSKTFKSILNEGNNTVKAWKLVGGCLASRVGVQVLWQWICFPYEKCKRNTHPKHRQRRMSCPASTYRDRN